MEPAPVRLFWAWPDGLARNRVDLLTASTVVWAYGHFTPPSKLRTISRCASFAKGKARFLFLVQPTLPRRTRLPFSVYGQSPLVGLEDRAIEPSFSEFWKKPVRDDGRNLCHPVAYSQARPSVPRFMDY